MKKHFLKQLAFTWFSKMDAKKPRKSDELSQPEGVKGGKPLTPDAKKEKNKKLLKRLLIWGIVLGILGGIIAIIVVFTTRKTEEYINNPQIAVLDGTSNGGNNGVPKGPYLKVSNDTSSRTWYVDLTNPNNLLTTYYNATSSQIQLRLQPTSGLPIVFDISRTQGYGQVNGSGQPVSYWVYNLGKNGGTITVDMTTNKVLASTNNDIPKTNGTTVTAGTMDASTLFATMLADAYSWATTHSPGFNWWGLFSLLVPIIIVILLFWFYSSAMKKQMGSGQDSIFGMGKANVKPTKTNVRFNDVAGIDEVKDELKEIVDYIQNPGRYAAMGARAPKGVILYGPPGTGKTLIAKAVAGEANCSFYAIAGSAFEDMLVGVGAKRVRDLFAKARKDAPAIIFIDEIDSVASKRGKNDIMGGGGVADQTINQLLAEMDGFTTDSGVVVIAATNRLDVLDDAILRPGRFDRQIQVTLPDIKGREAILKIHSRNKNLSSKVNLLDVARRTPGFSGAQLENVLNEATLLAVRAKKTVITMAEIDEAIDRVIGGPARHGRVISEADRTFIAYHEAGHALVGLHTDDTEVVQKITIIPRGDAAGYTLQTPADAEGVVQRKSQLLNQVRMTLGGRAAEEIIFGKDNIGTGASNDLYKVTNIVRAMVMQLGMSNVGLMQFVPSEGVQNPYAQRLYSEQTARELDQKIEDIIQKEYQKAKDIIIQNRRELDLIVETLLILETIVKEQIDYIHEKMELPPEAIKAKELQEQAKKDVAKVDKEDEKQLESKEDSSNNNDEPENKQDSSESSDNSSDNKDDSSDSSNEPKDNQPEENK